jgi:hypothetical protein
VIGVLAIIEEKSVLALNVFEMVQRICVVTGSQTVAVEPNHDITYA